MMLFSSLLRKVALLFLVTSVSYATRAQEQKEVLLIGTMHTVPKIVKNSYKPMLRKAKKYNPEAIYVERVLKTDSISLAYYYKNFLVYSDSIARQFTPNKEAIKKLNGKELSQMSVADFAYLKDYYCVERDFANFKYYQYLERYGIEGKKKPSRNENDDLSHLLAIDQGLRIIYSMDDQQTNDLYSKNWRACAKLGKENGDAKRLKKMYKKDYRADVRSCLTQSLGHKTNKIKHLETYHQMNSFRYVSQESEACSLGTKYWDLRNEKMAKHIGEQVQNKESIRNVVIVGAGHIIGLKESLVQNYPDIKIILFNDKSWR